MAVTAGLHQRIAQNGLEVPAVEIGLEDGGKQDGSTSVRPAGHQRAPDPLRRQLQDAGADGAGVPGLVARGAAGGGLPPADTGRAHPRCLCVGGAAGGAQSK